MEAGERYRVEGSVETIVYHNEENGFTVLELSTEAELLTVVGEFSDIAVGETLIVTGAYTTHAKYGMQLRAEAYERLMPATASAIASYLSSGAVKGVGPAIARRLVRAFGDDTLTVMEQNPAKLAEIQGISPKKAEQISNEYKKLFGIRSVMLNLEKLGIPAPYAIKTWKKYGTAAQEIVSENPYALCIEEIGVPFELADAAAERSGLAPDSYERISAGLLHVLRHNVFHNGHTCLPEEKLLETAALLVETDTYHVSDALEELIARGELVRLAVKDRSFLYLPRYYEAECCIVNRLSLMLSKGAAEHAPDMEEILGRLER